LRFRPGLCAGTGNLYRTELDQSPLRRAAGETRDCLPKELCPNRCDEGVSRGTSLLSAWDESHFIRVAHSLGLPDNLIDFPTDTNRAVAQMHYTNRLARTPQVKYIFSHAGGSIPYLAARFAIIASRWRILGLRRGSITYLFN
jgi:hypothetical protein